MWRMTSISRFRSVRTRPFSFRTPSPFGIAGFGEKPPRLVRVVALVAGLAEVLVEEVAHGRVDGPVGGIGAAELGPFDEPIPVEGLGEREADHEPLLLHQLVGGACRSP